MRTRLSRSLARMASSAGPTFQRFWASVGCTVALTITLIRNLTGPYPRPTEMLNRLSLAMVAGILTSWCAVLLWEALKGQRGNYDKVRVQPAGQGADGPNTGEQGADVQSADGQSAGLGARSALMGNLIALAAAAIVTWATYTMLKGFTFVALSRHTAMCAFLFLLFFIIPHVRKNRGLGMYVVRLFVQAVIAVLFSAVMFIGLAGITFTVSSLFSLKISHYVYLRLWLIMAGIMAPFLFMAGIPRAGLTVERHEYPKVLSNLMVYVVTPLLTAYTFILYLYFAKILITRQWPVGLVSHLVLWYSVATTAVLYFVWPLASVNKWAETFSRYFIKAVIPLLAMMFVSIGIRIKHYGITENRYYVLVLGLWVLGSMIYLNIAEARRGSEGSNGGSVERGIEGGNGASDGSIVLPVSLAIVVALSVLGPWSSFSVAKWSQNQRLEGLCAQYGIVKGGAIPPSSEIPPADRREIIAIISYFDRYHNLSDVKFLPPGFAWTQFEQVFGFSRMADQGYVVPVQPMYYEAANWSMDITGHRYLFDFTRPYYKDGTALSLSQGDVVAAYDLDSKSVTVKLNGQLEWEGSLPELIAGIVPKYETESGRIEFRPEDMVFEATGANLGIRIVVTSMWGEADPLGGEPVVHQAAFFLLIRMLMK